MVRFILVPEFSTNEFLQKIVMNGLTQGVYFLKAQSDGGEVTAKILKK